MSFTEIKKEGKRLGAAVVVITESMGAIFFYDEKTARDYASGLSRGKDSTEVKCYKL